MHARLKNTDITYGYGDAGRLCRQPISIALDQRAAVAGGVALARHRLPFDGGGCGTADDDGAAADAVAHAGDRPAVDGGGGRAADDGAGAMERAGVSMANKGDGDHGGSFDQSG